MREIDVGRVTEAVQRMCISSNLHLPEDVKKALVRFHAAEDWRTAKVILSQLLKNCELAKKEEVPICQDTGMACVFLEVGQEVHLTGGNLYDAVNEGVRRGYIEGYLRKSVEADPIRRGNTEDNTPALITTGTLSGLCCFFRPESIPLYRSIIIPSSFTTGITI